MNACPKGPRKAFQLRFQLVLCDSGYFQLLERLPKEKVTAFWRENCQSIVDGQRSESVILHQQLLKPLNGIIEVQVSEVTSNWFNGTMWL